MDYGVEPHMYNLSCQWDQSRECPCGGAAGSYRHMDILGPGFTVRRHEVSLNGYESFSQLACRKKGKLSPIPESMHTLVQPRVGVKQLPMG